mgnify:CR=1 FL=1
MCGSRVRPGSRAQNAFLLAPVRGLECPMAKPSAHRLRRRPGWFRPVPLRTRRDGWNVTRQCAFLVQLYLTGSAAAAARHVGMSRASAYRLRARPEARSFAGAWDRVLTPPGSGRFEGARGFPKGDGCRVDGAGEARAGQAGDLSRRDGRHRAQTGRSRAFEADAQGRLTRSRSPVCGPGQRRSEFAIRAR